MINRLKKLDDALTLYQNSNKTKFEKLSLYNNVKSKLAILGEMATDANQIILINRLKTKVEKLKNYGNQN